MLPKLTACMMVKNEEDLLSQCLSSIKDICDEIIVCDTGSEDKTIEIAESFGATIYHSPWKNDFSYHRNESISKAVDADFILIIDADEKLITTPGITKKEIKEWLTTLPENIGALALMVQDIQEGSVVMRCNSARLFRRGKIRYEGKIHNQPKFEGSCGLCSSMYIEHYGYGLSKAKMEKKFRRTRKALMKEYHSNSNNLQVPFYLCQLYGQHGDLKASAKWGDEYLNRKDDMGGDFNETIYFTQVRNYQAMGDYKKAQELLRMGLKDDPFNPDLGLALSDQGTFTKENALVAEGARRFLKGYSNCINKPHTMGGRFYFTLRKDAFVLMLYRLCISCLHEARDAWNLFKPNKELADPKMMEEFKSNLSSLGFNDLLAELREEDVLPLPELKSLPLAV